MRRLSLVLLLSTASPALAQEAQEAAAAPPAESAPKAPEPAPAAESAPSTESAPAPAAEKPARRSRAPKPEAAPESPPPAAAAQAPAPAPIAAPPAPAPASVPAALAALDPETSRREDVREEARYLLSSLLSGDVRSIAPSLSYPFQLEERRFDTPESLVVTWIKQLRQKRTDLITLYDIEVLPYAELEKKYGKPPARLGAIVPRGSGEVYAAVANLSGRAAIILYRDTLEGWSAFAYTD